MPNLKHFVGFLVRASHRERARINNPSSKVVNRGSLAFTGNSDLIKNGDKLFFVVKAILKFSKLAYGSIGLIIKLIFVLSDPDRITNRTQHRCDWNNPPN